jgi:hypothetical protein
LAFSVRRRSSSGSTLSARGHLDGDEQAGDDGVEQHGAERRRA